MNAGAATAAVVFPETSPSPVVHDITRAMDKLESADTAWRIAHCEESHAHAHRAAWGLQCGGIHEYEWDKHGESTTECFT